MKRSLAIIVTLASGLVLSAAAQTTPAPALAGNGNSETTSPQLEHSGGGNASSSPAPASAGMADTVKYFFMKAISQTNEGHRVFVRTNQHFEPMREQILALHKEIETLTKDLQEQGNQISPAENARRSKIIEDKKRYLQQYSEEVKNGYVEYLQKAFLEPDVLYKFTTPIDKPAVVGDLSGEWRLDMKFPGQGVTKMNLPALYLKQQGDNLFGIITERSIWGTVHGSDVTFTISFESAPVGAGDVVFTGLVVDAATMEGTVTMSQLGPGTWSAMR